MLTAVDERVCYFDGTLPQDSFDFNKCVVERMHFWLHGPPCKFEFPKSDTCQLRVSLLELIACVQRRLGLTKAHADIEHLREFSSNLASTAHHAQEWVIKWRLNKAANDGNQPFQSKHNIKVRGEAKWANATCDTQPSRGPMSWLGHFKVGCEVALPFLRELAQINFGDCGDNGIPYSISGVSTPFLRHSISF